MGDSHALGRRLALSHPILRCVKPSLLMVNGARTRLLSVVLTALRRTGLRRTIATIVHGGIRAMRGVSVDQGKKIGPVVALGQRRRKSSCEERGGLDCRC